MAVIAPSPLRNLELINLDDESIKPRRAVYQPFTLANEGQLARDSTVTIKEEGEEETKEEAKEDDDNASTMDWEYRSSFHAAII